MLFDIPQDAYSQSSSPDALRDSYLFAEPNKQSVAFQTKRVLQQEPDHHHIICPHVVRLDSQKSIQYKKMIEASREALNAAIEVASPGTNVGIIGHAVQDTIESYGYRPIANLTGHGIKRYNLHSGVSIPSVRERGGAVLRNGDVIAIEPFVTNGAGRVGGKRNSNIYQLRQVRKIRDEKATELMMEIKERYHGLPFAERWVHSIQANATKNLQKLVRAGVVSYYPILEELGKGTVTQAEHTVMITSSGVEVLTA